MAYATKRNDTRPLLTLTLTVNDVALNLTGAASAKLLMKSGSELVERSLAFLTPRTNGQVQATFVGADTDLAGNYDCEVEITWAANQIQTIPNDGYFPISIVQDLG